MFSIQSNSMAMSTLRNLNNAGFAMGKSMEKLSSGFRINTAADGPSDLIASEQLRSQIEGLEKAIRNAQTAGDIMDTADGALGQVQNIISDMRKLALHAMNSGITTAEQTAADQAQLDAGLQAIDRIISTTNFAGRKLLDGLNLGQKYGVGGNLTVKGGQGDAETGGKPPSLLEQLARKGYLNAEELKPLEQSEIKPVELFDDEGKLLDDKQFTISGLDGEPESVETFSFAAGTSKDDIIAKLRNYAIAPEQREGLDPDFQPPAIRLGDDINKVDLDLDTLAHFQGLNDEEAAQFLSDFMGTFARPLDISKIEKLDLDKLTEGERALYELSQNLMDMSMGGLGTVDVVVGKDENGNDIVKTLSMQDLYSGGAASLKNNADATYAILSQAGKDISGMRAQIAASRKYAVEADQNLLYSQLESYTRMESFLRDTDYATEMTAFTRSKLVTQVGTQMLSAVFDHSQSILNLFA